ncbi:hypothetical protein lerEdw1_002040 [Lerista edwardsae]|nr:hypothetical protein lerEdw1_002040 [Lerista edwardsae]
MPSFPVWIMIGGLGGLCGLVLASTLLLTQEWLTAGLHSILGKSRSPEPTTLALRMSEKRTGTVLKKCQKCKVDMNGDMLDAYGLCPRCKVLSGEEQPKSQAGKRDTAAYNANEAMDEPAFSDFITCHRTGRRNAVHELQGDATRLNLEKLAGTMDEISIAEGGECSFFLEDHPELPR